MSTLIFESTRNIQMSFHCVFLLLLLNIPTSSFRKYEKNISQTDLFKKHLFFPSQRHVLFVWNCQFLIPPHSTTSAGVCVNDSNIPKYCRF